jgi:hypothetical protein
MKRKIKMGKDINQDVVLCRTTSTHAGNVTTKKLMEDSISFNKYWKRIPFFLRDRFRGASEICIISINRNEYAAARRSIDCLEYKVRRRLKLNVL